MDQPVCLDDRGFRTLQATEQFGDFSIATVSSRIRPLLDLKRDGGILPIAAARIRRKSQFRVWFDDGDCIVGNYVRRRGYVGIEYTRSTVDHYDASDKEGKKPRVGVLQSICSVEDTDGRERIFFTLKNSGFVYEMDRGDSFDGHRIPGLLRFPWNDFGAPHLIKRFKKILIGSGLEVAVLILGGRRL